MRRRPVDGGASRGLIAIAVLLPLFFFCEARGGVDLERLAGSDLGMGVGARAMGMGGAFASIADDASAMYWNPSGLTRLPENQLLLSGNVANDFSAAVMAFRPGFFGLSRYQLAIGIGWINRLSFSGDSGAGTWAGFASHLLHLAMIPAGGDYSGKVDSRTADIRLSVALRPPALKNISIGLTAAHIS